MDYGFVNDLSEELTCQVCMRLLNEPQLTDCCGQNFCRACLDQWFQQKGKKQCPHCRSEDFTHILNKPLQRKIKEVKVYCPKRKEGCKETMKIEELERHLSKENTNGCGYVTVECANEGCKETCFKKDLSNHTHKKCKYREVKCKYCGKVGQYNHIMSRTIGGHKLDCLEYHVGCPNKCGTVSKDLKRKNLKAHREVCPLEPVKCPFSEAGCKEQLVRKDLDRHIQTNTQQHLRIVMDSHKTLTTEYRSLMSKHEAIVTKQNQLESTVAGVTAELKTLMKKGTLTDRGTVKSLDKITETLSHASLRLVKDGDQLVFKYTGSFQNWASPAFHANDIRMTIVYCRDDWRLSLVWMGGELDGKYGVRVETNLVDDVTGHQFYHSIMTGVLCSKCTELSEKVSSSEESGREIAYNYFIFFRLLSTLDITVTLIEHKC